MPVPLTGWSVDEDRRADRHDAIQKVDVLVAKTHAPVTHGVSDRCRIVGAVQCVTVAEIEAMVAEHTVVATLMRAVRRNDNVSTDDDLATFGDIERHEPTIRILLHDIAANH